MAVEKMSMLNVVGNINEVDNVVKDLILSGKVSLVNSLKQIEENSFMFNVEAKNVEKAIELNSITSFTNREYCEDCSEKINELKSIYGEKLLPNMNCLNEKYNLDESIESFHTIYDKLTKLYGEFNSAKEEINHIDEFYKNFIYIKDVNVNIEDLRKLEYFSYTFGVLSKEDRLKLRKNYENILAAVFHTGSSENGEVYLIIYPNNVREECERVLRSLNFKNIDIPEYFSGTPEEILKSIERKRSEIANRMKELEDFLNKFKKDSLEEVECFLGKVYVAEKIKQAKEQMACSNNFFYLSAWIPDVDRNEIEDILSNYEGLLVIFNAENGMHKMKTPTKLRNNKLFKPFETLVNMYGIPSYNELDPTPFLSITYMFLFGAMFGDLGQGMILLIGGLLLSKKQDKKVFGQILIRLGLSSMIFGVLYGAFFGFGNVIPALLIRPFENINTILKSAVIIGIFLIFISYVYSILNSIKRKNLKEGLFGKNGVVGFAFYILLLSLLGGKLLNKTIIPRKLGGILSVVFIGLMVFKEPLSNILLKKRPLYDEDVSSYYIESGFSILETLLSMLSGTVSFIRVGAFALTHVGLFIAFQTIGKMIGTQVGNIIVLLLGNVIIIGLEGLIVFIQGLRLEYYELFSRYYEGEGIEFKPIRFQ